MKQADLETRLQFTLEDMMDRVGMLDHFQESLAMFEKVQQICRIQVCRFTEHVGSKYL